MEYRIGDLSKLFHMSPEMIRYYEKQGIIKSVRKESNNYRTYNIWDIFSFLEMLQYREMGISAKDIVKFKEHNYSEHLREYLTEYYEKTKNEISYKWICQDRAAELIDRTECYEMNQHNYWVRKIPKQYLFHLVSSKDEEYNRVDMPKDICDELFSSHIVNFLDPLVEFGTNQEWWYAISEKYVEQLNLSYLSQATILEEQYCLCTVVNMGDIGEFSDGCIQTTCAYIKEKNYIQTGPITGIILGRGIEYDKYVRYMEIRVPIRRQKP